jgi:hypothetical protein
MPIDIIDTSHEVDRRVKENQKSKGETRMKRVSPFLIPGNTGT